MRTTITIADDVAEEMRRLRRTQGLGPSEALNLLARRGMVRESSSSHYVLEPQPLGQLLGGQASVHLGQPLLEPSHHIGGCPDVAVLLGGRS